MTVADIPCAETEPLSTAEKLRHFAGHLKIEGYSAWLRDIADELDDAREQCRAAEAQFADMLKRQGRHHPDGSVTLPWSAVEAYLRRSAPAPEPEQRPADPPPYGLDPRATKSFRRSSPSLGRHAGLAGQEGEGP